MFEQLKGKLEPITTFINNEATQLSQHFPNLDLKTIGIMSASTILLKNLLRYNFLTRVIFSTGMLVAAFFTKNQQNTFSKIMHFLASVAALPVLAMFGPFFNVALAAVIGTIAFAARHYGHSKASHADTLAQVMIPAALFAAPYEMIFGLGVVAAAKCSLEYFQKNATPGAGFNATAAKLCTEVTNGFSGLVHYLSSTVGNFCSSAYSKKTAP